MDPLAAKTVAAATGATLTALTMTPFDVVKTRIQTQITVPFPPMGSSAMSCCQPSPAKCVRNMSSIVRPLHSDVVCLWEDGLVRNERINGFWDAVLKVWRAEGPAGLWRGAGTTLAMAVPSATAYMVLYDHLLREVIPSISPSPILVPLISGAASRSIVSTLASPLELLRTNLQATPTSPSRSNTLRSVILDLNQLVHKHGVRSLWRGLGPTLWRDVPFSALYWANYELCKGQLERRGRGGPSGAFVSGAFSGTFAAVLTSPFDVLKTRRQAISMRSSVSETRSSGTFRLIKTILNEEGIKALFAGLSPRIAKIAPACGIMIASFEGVGALLTRREQ